MAKASSILALIGNVEGMNFYKTRNGYFVRAKSSIAISRIKNDPEFARTRENNEEFENAQRASTVFRQAIANATNNVKSGSSTHKLMSALCAVRNQDYTSVRGKRTFATGIQTEKGKTVLKGFNFNETGQLFPQFLNLFELDTGTGILNIPGVKMQTDFPKPPGADKVGITLFWARIDFETTESQMVSSPETILQLYSDIVQDVVLTVNSIPNIIGNDIFMIRVVYYKTIGDGQVMLISPGDSVCRIIAVK